MLVATSTPYEPRSLNEPNSRPGPFNWRVAVSHVQDLMVSLREIPERGDAAVLVEMTHNDRDTLGYAASLVGMSKQKFARAVLVSAANRMLKEMGVKTT